MLVAWLTILVMAAHVFASVNDVIPAIRQKIKSAKFDRTDDSGRVPVLVERHITKVARALAKTLTGEQRDEVINGRIEISLLFADAIFWSPQKKV